MHYEWDLRKATVSFQKHGVDFREATSVFRDPLSVTLDDPDHSENERRSITFGMSSQGRLLFVAHVDLRPQGYACGKKRL